MDLSFGATEARLAAEVRGVARSRTWSPNRTSTHCPSGLSDAIEWGRRWQARLAAAGWVGIDWPAEYGGRGATPVEVAVFNSEYARVESAAAREQGRHQPGGPDTSCSRDDEQLGRWLRPITTADEIWCQLFSEPGAGSDLAGLSTRAARDSEGGWLVSGQKVWTSYAQFARLGALPGANRSRSPPAARGLTLLALDMKAPGVDIRPLVQMTGDAEFNEVFLDEVFVSRRPAHR